MFNVYDATDQDAWEMGLKSDADRMAHKMERALRHQELSSAARKKGKHQLADDASRAARKIRLRVTNAISDIHNRFKFHMVTNFAFVAHGDINVKNIVKNRSRNEQGGLSRASKNRMYLWSHCRLKQALLHRAKGTDCIYIIQNEAYTTKTCGQCDRRNNSMTLSDRTFNCDRCGYESHRDVNAARNILRRGLGLWDPCSVTNC